MADIERRFNFKAGDTSALSQIERVNAALRRQSELTDEIFERNQRAARGVDDLSDSFQRFIQQEQRASSIIYQPRRPISFQNVGGNLPGETRSPDAGRALGATERLLRGVGARAGGELSGLIGDVLDVRDAMADLPPSFRGVVSAIGPLGLTVGAAAVGLGVLSEVFRKLEEQAKRTAEAVKTRAGEEFDAQQALSAGDLEALEKRQNDLLLERQRIQFQIGELEAARADILAQYPDLIESPFLESLPVIGGAFRGTFAQLRQQIESLQQDLGKTEDPFFAVSQALNTADAEALRAARSLKELKESTKDAFAGIVDYVTSATGALAGGLRQVGEGMRDLSERYISGLTKQLRDAESAAEDLRAQEEALTGAYIDGQAQRRTSLARQEARDQKILDRQLQLDADAHGKRLIEIQQRGNAAIAALEEQRSDQRRQIERQEWAELVRYQRERMRLSEDANDNILDAIREGDFSAARDIEIQRDKDRRRLDEDYLFEAGLRDQANDEVLASIEVRVEAERKATEDALVNLQLEYEERQRLAAEERQFRADLAAEDRRQMEADIDERYRLQKDALDGLLIAELERIEITKQALQAASQGVLDAFLANVAAKLPGIFNLLGLAGPLLGGVLPKIPILGSLLPLPSFDTGSRYIPRDMVAQLHAGERVLTADENRLYSMSQGINGAGNRGAANYLQMSFEGMFNGANIGAQGFEGVEPMIAFAQEQMAIAVRNQIARMTQGRN